MLAVRSRCRLFPLDRLEFCIMPCVPEAGRRTVTGALARFRFPERNDVSAERVRADAQHLLLAAVAFVALSGAAFSCWREHAPIPVEYDRHSPACCLLRGAQDRSAVLWLQSAWVPERGSPGGAHRRFIMDAGARVRIRAVML